MENLLMILASSLVSRLIPKKQFRVFPVGSTGCTALLEGNDIVFDSAVTGSGDTLYFHEFREKEASFGLICIKMLDEYDRDEALMMLTAYMEKLRGPLYVLHHTGLRRAADWNSETSVAVMDYWQDSEGVDWKVKGYTNGRVMAVLYVRNISEVSVSRTDLFLDGFGCPGLQ
jgi:hypothetical protein